MADNELERMKTTGMCAHGNFPSSCALCGRAAEAPLQSSREYKPSPVIEELRESRIIFEREITPDSKICLIGDGQGMDTQMILGMGVKPENVSTLNFDATEIDTANANALNGTGVEMKFADATEMESLNLAGIGVGTQDAIILMHVIETPIIRGDVEQRLVENMSKLLSVDGEALVTQYKKMVSFKEAEFFNVQKIGSSELQEKYGENWRERFRTEFGQDWHEGMFYSDISHIRRKEELVNLFSGLFDVRIDETDDSFVLRLKKGTNS